MSTARRWSFEGHQGSALTSAFDDLLGEQAPSGLMMNLADYPQVFQTAFGDRVVRRPEWRMHPCESMARWKRG